jgi:hypothetical protein
MKPHVLIVDDSVSARVQLVRAHALQHRETLSDLMRRMNQPERAIGNDPNFVVKIHAGWRLVYSLEQQPDPVGWCEHLSISLSLQHKSIEPPLAIFRRVFFPLFMLNEKNLIKVWLEETLKAPKQKYGNALFLYPHHLL